MSEVKMSELQKLVDKKVDLQKLECYLWTTYDRKYRVKREYYRKGEPRQKGRKEEGEKEGRERKVKERDQRQS